MYQASGSAQQSSIWDFRCCWWFLGRTQAIDPDTAPLIIEASPPPQKEHFAISAAAALIRFRNNKKTDVSRTRVRVALFVRDEWPAQTSWAPQK